MLSEKIATRWPEESGRFITQEEYDAWRRHFVFDGLRHLRYGQSFCRHFEIQDNLVFYAQTVAEADTLIRKYYLR